MTSLAADLDSAAGRAELVAGITDLQRAADGLPLVRAVLDELRANADLAWNAYACALLAEELADDD